MKIDLHLPFRHWPLKLLALVIATALWYGIAAEDKVDITMSVPLELRNLPPNMIIANQYQKVLDVSVRGSKRLLQEVQQQHLSRPVDLAKAEPGQTVVVQNTPQSVPFPRGVMVQRVQPANVTLQVDQLVERQIPLSARTVGTPAKGLILDSVQLKPATITVSGPRSLIGSVQTIETAPINVAGMNRNHTVQVSLALNSTLKALIGETMVEGSLLFRAALTRRTVPVRVHLKPEEKGLAVVPGTVNVTADIPLVLAQSTPDLASLFHASINASETGRNGWAPIRIETDERHDQVSINIVSVRPDQARLFRDSRESKESRSTKEARETKEPRFTKEARETKEPRSTKEARESHETREQPPDAKQRATPPVLEPAIKEPLS